MYVEICNTTDDVCYYLSGTVADPKIVEYGPDVKETLLSVNELSTVAEFLDFIRPLVENLMTGSLCTWEVKLFKFNDEPSRSLTRHEPTKCYGIWVNGDAIYLDGVKQRVRFHSVL